MKANLIYEYNPDDDSDREAIKTIQNAMEYKLALFEVANFLRTKIKYGNLSEEVELELQAVRDKLFEELNDRGITLD